jgi:hypothetical protein
MTQREALFGGAEGKCLITFENLTNYFVYDLSMSDLLLAASAYLSKRRFLGALML